MEVSKFVEAHFVK
jgi:serine/threonine protein phosphatase PrpC